MGIFYTALLGVYRSFHRVKHKFPSQLILVLRLA
jgi:hypothetical protein